MGTMKFLLPGGLDAEAVRGLEQACVAGDPDNFPLPTEAQVKSGELLVRRAAEESGCLVVPWELGAAGHLMSSTGTLIERSQPYQLPLELARGKVNQLRCQTADWQQGGLQLPPPLAQQVRQATLNFSKAVTQPPSDAANQVAQGAVELGYQAAEQLVLLYVHQMFAARHQRQPRLETQLGCRLNRVVPPGAQGGELLRACNSVCLPLDWRDIEPAESSYRWEPYDALVDWAKAQGLAVTIGPVVDFTPGRLPDWLWLWEKDPASIAKFMCDYVETAVKRYSGRVRSWQLTAGTNCASVLALEDEELLWLTVRLAEVARHVHPKVELIAGISRPWGEYAATEARTHSPLVFADTLLRSGINLAALDLELIMGVAPRGSYCRDLLEVSRLLDLYSVLGVPLRVTLAYPSASGFDQGADEDLKVAAGHWHGGVSLEGQADWAAAFGALAVCKPYVRGVHWVHCADAAAHQFPHCGLFDAGNNPKPALRQLASLREQHLR